MGVSHRFSTPFGFVWSLTFFGVTDGFSYSLLRTSLYAIFSMDFSNPLIIIIGGVFIYGNFMTVGSVMAFMLYFQKVNAIFGNASAMIPLFKISQGSAERLYEVFKCDNDIVSNNDNTKITVKNCIEFKNVSFSYEHMNKNILENFSMKLFPQKINALVGVSGAGKTTIINLILRFIKESSGCICIDGKNIDEFNTNNIRNAVALLPQEPFLFHRTLKENICYHLLNDDTNKKNIKKALANSCADGIILKMPQGMETILIDGGKNISGGERQRICIARELLKNSSIFIMDEATSALDSLSEKIIQDTIKDMVKTKMIFIIAHKLESIKDADIIYVMKNGRICESGNHESLLKKRGEYFSLYAKQQNEKG